MIKIYEFSTKNYSSKGRLKKNAQTIFTQITDQKYSIIAKKIKKTLPIITNITTPYVFTHIAITAGDKTYIVYQDFMFADGKTIPCSPTELLKELRK